MTKDREEARRQAEELKRELAAAVLFDAAFTTDAEAAAMHGLSERSVQRYRSRLAEDALLAGLLAARRRAFERSWTEKLPVTPAGTANALDEIARDLRAGKSVAPETVERIAATLRAAADALPSRGASDVTVRRERHGDGRKGPAQHKW